MNVRRLALLGALTLLLMMALVGVAVAHQGWVFQGADKAGTYEAHRHIDWCDEESDGRKVRARFWMVSVFEEVVSDWDPDGAGGQCGHEPDLVSNITKHKVCAEVDGCSAFEPH